MHICISAYVYMYVHIYIYLPRVNPINLDGLRIKG